MSAKFNISFNVDLSHIAPELMLDGRQPSEAEVSEVITSKMINQARAFAKSEYHRIRKDASMDNDVKAIKMAEQMQKMMLTLMAQANLEVSLMPESTHIETELPFERRMAA